MKKIIATGKTIDEAIDSAIQQLGTNKENVNINIIEKPGKRLFGLMGTKEAVVEVEIIEANDNEQKSVSKDELVPEDDMRNDEVTNKDSDIDPLENATIFLDDLFKSMDIQVQIERFNQQDHVVFNLIGKDLGILIGRRGQTLDALQYLVNIVANKHVLDKKRIVLDAENYRSKRKATLEDLAEKLASKVIRTGQDVILEPMTPLERKIIHSQLQNHPKIETYSVGEEPNRKIVISLK